MMFHKVDQGPHAPFKTSHTPVVLIAHASLYCSFYTRFTILWSTVSTLDMSLICNVTVVLCLQHEQLRFNLLLAVVYSPPPNLFFYESSVLPNNNIKLTVRLVLCRQRGCHLIMCKCALSCA